jgi:hypothetical protein
MPLLVVDQMDHKTLHASGPAAYSADNPASAGGTEVCVASSSVLNAPSAATRNSPEVLACPRTSMPCPAPAGPVASSLTLPPPAGPVTQSWPADAEGTFGPPGAPRRPEQKGDLT